MIETMMAIDDLRHVLFTSAQDRGKAEVVPYNFTCQKALSHAATGDTFVIHPKPVAIKSIPAPD